MSLLQLALKPLILPSVEVQVAIVKDRHFRPRHLARNQVINVRKSSVVIEMREIRLDLAGAHQANAGQEHAVDVKERLDPRRLLLLEEPPLSFRKAPVMVIVMPRNARMSDRL